jgi:DNA-binding MarR family transcriptional regulator
MNERFETFTVLIAKVSRNIRKIKIMEMAEYGIRSAHVSCLYYLYTEPFCAAELCERCEEDKATISRTLDSLEENGFIVCEAKTAKRYKSPLTLTEKGKEAGALTQDSIAFSVRQRAENAVARFNRQIRRSSYVKTQILPRENGDFSVLMSLDDEMGNLMTLELMAPNQRQAVRLSRLFEKKAEIIYNLTMTELLDEEEEADD